MASRAQELRQAVRRAKRFHGRDPRRAGWVEIPYPKALVLLGAGVAIEYRSDKVWKRGDRFNPKLRTYRHELGRGVRVFADPKGRTLIIKGGRFRVTDWMRD